MDYNPTVPLSRKSCFEPLERRQLLAIAPLGAAFRVNTTTAGNQYAPAVANDTAGNFVVAWVSPDADRAGTDVYAQRYAANGTALGAEVRVNTVTTGFQYQPDVAMDASGNFIVAWTSENIVGGSGRDVVYRRFASNGTAFGTTETLVNQTTLGDQESPSIACATISNFAVAWDSDSGDGNDYDTYVRPFNLTASTSANELRLNTLAPGPQTDPSIDMNTAGDYAVTWSSAVSSTATDYDIYLRRFRGGVLQATQLVSDDASTDYQVLPSVAVAADGRAILAWSSYGVDGSDYGIRGRIFSAAGTAGSTFNVNTYTSGQQTHATVDAAASGEFTVAWDSVGQDGSGIGVYRQSYSAAGVVLGAETRVNTITANDQSFPAITLNADGDAVIVWQDGSTAINGNGADGSGYGVYAQRFGHPPTVSSAAYNYLTGQSLTFAFSEDVGASLGVGDVTLNNLTTGQTIAASSVALNYNATTRVATITPTTTLPNGNYTATLTAAGITDAVGTPLDGNGDGVGGDNFTLSFFVLAGDANRDRVVDVSDLGILASHWQQSGQNYSTGDFNGDGLVDVLDLGILSSNWQASVPAPSVSVAMIVPPAKGKRV